jgi:hypothetical protein
MTIAFHDNSLSLRGTTVALYDYAYYNRQILKNNSIILYDLNHRANNQDVYNKFSKEFRVYGYRHLSEIDSILAKEKCSHFVMLKGGKPDGVISNVSKNCINAISICNESNVHGDIFAMGSRWLSRITNWKIPYVPYMVNLPNIDTNMRSELNIPIDALVLGRNGGLETFDIKWAKEAIIDILDKRSDIWFVFQFTEQFIQHERVIYLDGSSSLENKVRFINTCDAMIHAREVGESFGLSCAEFSTRNKPVITWDGSPEKNHIETLADKGIFYQDKKSLTKILTNLDKKELNSKDWNMYQEYTPEKVMEKFKNIYLHDN